MKSFKNIFILTIALILLGCSDHPQESDISESQKSAVEPGLMDQRSKISIGPLHAGARSIITLRTRDNDLNGSDIHWYINEMEEDPSRGLRFASHALKKGDIVKAVIKQGRKEYQSNEILIMNSAPSIHKARLLPALPVASSKLTVEAAADDIDGDYITFQYNWTRNGKFAGEESYLEEEFKRGDEITVTVTPLDSEESGKSVTLRSGIVNSLPEVSEGRHEFNDTLYRYQIPASDPDGDVLSYLLEEGPEGMNVDPSSGMITWDAGPADAGIYQFKVSVSDSHGGKILVPLTTVIRSQ